ncbi:MAG: Ribulose-5-phosphate 4-epimerase and related epimerases and aldolases, partial [uncultured Acetobacteraceae bacterium]
VGSPEGDPHRSGGRRVAHAMRSRRALPCRPPPRLDRPHQHAHVRPRARRARPFPDQSLRRDVRRDHRVEPGQDGHAGQRHRRPGPVQRRGVHHPQRRLQGAAGRDVRAAHPYPRRRRPLAPPERAAPDQPGRAARARRRRVPRIWRAGLAGGMRRVGRNLRQGKLRRAAQPRPPHLGRDHPRSVDAALHARASLRAGTHSAGDGRATGDDRRRGGGKGGRPDEEAARDAGLRPDGVRGLGAHGGPQGRGLPPL